MLSACRDEAGHTASISLIDFPDPGLKACVETTGVAYIDQVVALDCLGYGIFDLTGIQNFTELRSANFAFNALAPYFDSSGVEVAALEPLRDLTKLEFIDVEENFAMRSAEPLGALSALVSLNMSDMELDDAGLSGLNTGVLDALELLYIRRNFNITDITSLASLPALRYLDASGTSLDDAGLSGLTSTSFPALQSLVLRRDGNVTNMSNLDTLPLLSYLDISGTGLDDAGISGLTSSSFASLSTALLRENRNLFDVSPLALLTGLTGLDLGIDLAPAEVPILTANITSLSALVNASEIGLEGREPCADISTLQAALPNTIIKHNCP